MFGETVSVEYNQHFVNPKPPEKQIWEQSYEERVRHARDPKIQKLQSDQAQFQGMNVECIWDKLREVAVPDESWSISHAAFATFCKQCGLTSEHLIKRLLQIFDKEGEGSFNGIWFCRLLFTMINDPHNTIFAQAAFDVYDRDPFQESIDIKYFTDTLKLPDPSATQKKKKKNQPSDVFTEQTQGQVTYAIQTASRACLDLYSRPNPAVVTLADFQKWWAQDAALVGAFQKTILEVVSHVYYAKELPKLPSSFFKALEPIKEVPFSDADWWLLREYERTGFDPLNTKKPKKKKKK